MLIIRFALFLFLLVWVFRKTNQPQILVRINRRFIETSLKKLKQARYNYNRYLATNQESYLLVCNHLLALIDASITNKTTAINRIISDNPDLKDASVRHYLREFERINSEIAHIQYLGSQYKVFIQKNMIKKTSSLSK